MENSILSFREQSEETGGPIIIDLFFDADTTNHSLTNSVFDDIIYYAEKQKLNMKYSMYRQFS